MKMSFTKLLPFLLVVQLGCQSTQQLQRVFLAAFPTIDITDTLHIEVQDFLDWSPGYNSQMYLIFKDALLEAFEKLEYPGEVVISQWSSPSKDSVPHVYIAILGWGLDKDRDAYKCTIIASLSYMESKTDLGRIDGEDDTYSSVMESPVIREKAHRLSAEKAFKELFRRYLPYTNARLE